MADVLITGDSGSIGYALRALLRAKRRDLGVIGSFNSCGDRYDLRERVQAKRMLERWIPEIVIHAAASRYQPGDVDGFTRSSDDLRMTLNVLEAAREVGVKHVVFLSSSSVYENVHLPPYSPGWLVESTTEFVPMPQSPIGYSKRAGELAVQAWSKQTGSTHTIWRIFNVVTPLERHDAPAHVHVDLYRKLVIDRLSTIEVPDRAIRSFVWVDEVAEAIVGLLDRPEVMNQTLNLGSTDHVGMRDLANTIVGTAKRLGILHQSYIPIVEVRASDDDVRVPNIAKARALGWNWHADYARCMELFMKGKHGL